MILTTKEIEYHAAPYGLVGIIPAGTPCIPATNIPTNLPSYWVEPWNGMTEQEASWQRNYGFLVDFSQVDTFIPRLPRLDTLSDSELSRCPSDMLKAEQARRRVWCYAKK